MISRFEPKPYLSSGKPIFQDLEVRIFTRLPGDLWCKHLDPNASRDSGRNPWDQSLIQHPWLWFQPLVFSGCWVLAWFPFKPTPRVPRALNNGCCWETFETILLIVVYWVKPNHLSANYYFCCSPSNVNQVKKTDIRTCRGDLSLLSAEGAAGGGLKGLWENRPKWSLLCGPGDKGPFMVLGNMFFLFASCGLVVEIPT